jgi:hypothetical protein
MLKLGDSGEPVKVLQGSLNKFGAILLLDGDFGPMTCDAILDTRAVLQQPPSTEADDEFQQAIARHPDPFPPLTAAGVTFVARAEVSGPREYRRRYKRPAWPSISSGITIGIGYDLQFVDRDRLRADWEDLIPQSAIELLAGVVGRPGSEDLLEAVRSVEIPLPLAMSVFLDRTLPLYVEQTRSIYPELDLLSPPRRTALVSLVYNRGARLADRDPVRQERREMRTIRNLLRSGDFDAVGAELDSMARLWTLPGLVQRRHDEAKLWRAGFPALQLG